MKSIAFSIALAGLASLAKARIPGFDISGWQETTDFAKAYADGDRFVIIKVGTSSLFQTVDPILCTSGIGC
jgi:GH25 family lysozyme M1 (1,4-beta-N-acetylmuramidase)